MKLRWNSHAFVAKRAQPAIGSFPVPDRHHTFRVRHRGAHPIANHMSHWHSALAGDRQLFHVSAGDHAKLADHRRS